MCEGRKPAAYAVIMLPGTIKSLDLSTTPADIPFIEYIIRLLQNYIKCLYAIITKIVYNKGQSISLLGGSSLLVCLTSPSKIRYRKLYFDYCRIILNAFMLHPRKLDTRTTKPMCISLPGRKLLVAALPPRQIAQSLYYYTMQSSRLNYQRGYFDLIFMIKSYNCIRYT